MTTTDRTAWRAALDRRARTAGLRGFAQRLRHPVRTSYPSTRALRRRRHRGEGRLSTTRTFWGQEMTIALPEEVSVALHRRGFVDYDLTAFLLSHLRPGATVFDVGAHIGYYTVLAAALTGRGGTVLAFEPTPSTLTVLRRNAGRFPQARVVPAAVWSRRDELVLHDHGLGYSAYNSAFEARLPDVVRARIPSEPFTAATVVLDDYVRAEGVVPDFVKIDAESAEAHVLAGMRELLAGPRPVVSLEVGDLDVAGAPPSRTLVDTLTAAGYAPWELRDGTPVPHRPRDHYAYQNLLFAPAGHRLAPHQEAGPRCTT
ncbi:FkbM family methyltransferase [Streptomyces huiliensis]|uniref:FkbM family methyltransferase n=1 Tax=Streptomyces huiliensis TaxID=2876027 RepID=UPI001CBCA6D4|nr:FkbM family methyltransferase [Streptomyces huiliensis]MBZ4318410.1 FkbM family methyltransferase [Streptomyces huiliensis]